jgi:hypothetical protein
VQKEVGKNENHSKVQYWVKSMPAGKKVMAESQLVFPSWLEMRGGDHHPPKGIQLDSYATCSLVKEQLDGDGHE